MALPPGPPARVDNGIAIQEPTYALNTDNVEFNRVAAEGGAIFEDGNEPA